MYNLKTIEIRSSLYDGLPVIIFLWGVVFACTVKLLPQFIVYASVLISVISTFFTFLYYKFKKPIGHLSIAANQAVLITEFGRFYIEFEFFNSWRLFGVLIIDNDINTVLKPNVVLKLSRLIFKRSASISIYHTAITKDDFVYLRSFAAYQCFVRQAQK